MAKPELLLALRCQRRDFEILDLDEAVILAGFGDSAVQAFMARQLAIPEWLQNQQKALGRFIRLKHEEELELRLKRAEAARATHATVAERREHLDAEIAALTSVRSQ